MIGPLQEFRGLSEEDIMAAMREPYTSAAVAAEVDRLKALYTGNFTIHVMRLGYIPEDIRRLKGRWPIEEIAVRLARAELLERYPDKQSV